MMDASIRESLERTLVDVGALKSKIGCCRDLTQRVKQAAALVKKLYLADILGLMLRVENELSEQDKAEFRGIYLELAGRVDLLASSLLSGECLALDECGMDVLERIAPCLQGSFKDVTYYRNSRMIRIAG